MKFPPDLDNPDNYFQIIPPRTATHRTIALPRAIALRTFASQTTSPWKFPQIKCPLDNYWEEFRVESFWVWNSHYWNKYCFTFMKRVLQLRVLVGGRGHSKFFSRALSILCFFIGSVLLTHEIKTNFFHSRSEIIKSKQTFFQPCLELISSGTINQ